MSRYIMIALNLIKPTDNSMVRNGSIWSEMTLNTSAPANVMAESGLTVNAADQTFLYRIFLARSDFKFKCSGESKIEYRFNLLSESN